MPSTDALNLMTATAAPQLEPIVVVSDHPRNTTAVPQSIPGVCNPNSPGRLVGTWEKEVALTLMGRLQETDRRPLVVGIVGMPGSGKSVSAFLLASELEALKIPCMTMPHDGYHYTLQHLRSLPDADAAVYRRGAPDTFDPTGLIRDLKRIRGESTTNEDVVKVPGFDHAKGDPEPDAHVFDRLQHEVVICEGLYLLHDGDGWEAVKGLLDYSIFLDSDLEVCVQRVKIRNQCIPGYTVEEILERAEKVNRVNAKIVLQSKPYADLIVQSLASQKATNPNPKTS